MQIQLANWKSTLVVVRKQLNHCDPNTVGILSFHDLEKPLVCSANGERLWAEYILGSDHNDPWWSVQFTDTAFVVRDCESSRDIVPYSSLGSVELPRDFSSHPDVTVWREELFLSASGTLTLQDGRTISVHGGIRNQTIREVYMWYHIVKTAVAENGRHQKASVDSACSP